MVFASSKNFGLRKFVLKVQTWPILWYLACYESTNNFIIFPGKSCSGNYYFFIK